MRRGQSRLGYGKTKEVVIKGHKAGLTMTEIAKKYGLSRPAVNNCAYRNGLKFPYVRLKRPYGEAKADIFNYAEAGLTVKDMVKLGYSRGIIYYYRKHYGIHINKR